MRSGHSIRASAQDLDSSAASLHVSLSRCSNASSNPSPIHTRLALGLPLYNVRRFLYWYILPASRPLDWVFSMTRRRTWVSYSCVASRSLDCRSGQSLLLDSLPHLLISTCRPIHCFISLHAVSLCLQLWPSPSCVLRCVLVRWRRRDIVLSKSGHRTATVHISCS